MKDLAFHYSVSDRTIRRDILFLSRYAPICTKTGIDGGAVFNERVPKRVLFTFVHRRGKSFVKAYAYRLCKRATSDCDNN